MDPPSPGVHSSLITKPTKPISQSQSPRNRVLTYSNTHIARSSSNPVPISLDRNSTIASNGPEGNILSPDPTRPLSKTVSEIGGSESHRNRSWRHSTQVKVENAERMKILMPKQVSLYNLNTLQQEAQASPLPVYHPVKEGPNTLLTTVTPPATKPSADSFDQYMKEYLITINPISIRFNMFQRLFPNEISSGYNIMKNSTNTNSIASSYASESPISIKKEDIYSSTGRLPSSPINPQELEWNKILEDPLEHIEFTEEGYIKAGSFESILSYITNQKFTSQSCLNAFLLTYRSFGTPQFLLELLIVRFNVRSPRECLNNPEMMKYFEERKKKPVQIRTCASIRRWVDTHWYDFEQHPQLVDRLLSWVRGPLCQTDLSSTADSLEKLVIKKREGKERKGIKFTNAIPPAIVPKSDSFEEFSAKEVARQLALIEFEDYAGIHPTECMHQSWTKSDKEIKSPHIGKMIKRSNIIPMWVATQILVDGKQIKRRAKIFTQFIKIAKECNNLNNFNAVMEIMAGLQLAPIHRLKKTLELVSKKHLEILNSLQNMMTVMENWKLYRATLKQRDPPCIPYIGMYLTDLTFIEDGHPDFVNDGDLEMINFIKCRQLAIVIQDIQQYQQKSYAFHQVPVIYNYLQTLEHRSNDELYQLSLELEPREKNQ